jgi:hypothetical protein
MALDGCDFPRLDDLAHDDVVHLVAREAGLAECVRDGQAVEVGGLQALERTGDFREACGSR